MIRARRRAFALPLPVPTIPEPLAEETTGPHVDREAGAEPACASRPPVGTLLTWKEFADQLGGACDRTIRRYVEKGDIEVVKIGGKLRFTQFAIDQFIESRTRRRRPQT